MNQVPTTELMFSRKLRYTIPEISSKTGKNIAKEAEQSDQGIKEKSKRYQGRTQPV